MRTEDISGRCARAVEWLVCGAAVFFVAAYVFVALHRLAYPFDLEWMEGSMVQHVSRVLDGQPVYASPTLDYVPFLYPPLYYYVGAVAARVTGLGFFPLRLVSFVSSLAFFWLIYRLAARDTDSPYAGLVAAGLAAATYRIGGAWFDLARNDSLFLALMLAAIYLIRFRESQAGWASAGFLLALAGLTKQTALFMAPPFFVYAALVDRRKAIALMLTFGAVLGVATWALDVSTHGWYMEYVFRLPQRIQEHAGDRAPFWTHDIFRALPFASALGLATLISVLPPRDNRGAFWPVVLVSGIGAAWLSRLHSGAHDNVLIPAYACLALSTGIAGRRIPARVPSAYRGFVQLGVAVVCAVQLFGLRYPIAGQIPTAHDNDLAQQLGRRLAGSDGKVFAPFHSFIPTPSGPVMGAHAWAIRDILRAGRTAEAANLEGEIKYAFDQCVYRVVVIDKIDPWMEPDFDLGYRRSERVGDPTGLWTRTGYHTQPRWIYVARLPSPPIGHGAGNRR
jgi:hypothetical protein